MDQQRAIKAAAAYAGLTQSDIAEGMGMAKQGFWSKMKLGTFKDADLEKIAEIIGARYEARFEFPDGTRI